MNKGLAQVHTAGKPQTQNQNPGPCSLTPKPFHHQSCEKHVLGPFGQRAVALMNLRGKCLPQWPRPTAARPALRISMRTIEGVKTSVLGSERTEAMA